jgi:hypothetical protein
MAYTDPSGLLFDIPGTGSICFSRILGILGAFWVAFLVWVVVVAAGTDPANFLDAVTSTKNDESTKT